MWGKREFNGRRTVMILSAVLIPAFLILSGCGSGGSGSGGGISGAYTGIEGAGPSQSGASATSIRISPETAVVAKGATVRICVTGTYSDNTSQDITSKVHLVSSRNEVATVDGTGNITGCLEGKARITATDTTCNKNCSAEITVTPASLESIAVQPQNDSSYHFRIPATMPDPVTGVAAPTTFGFKAWGTYSDKTVAEITGMVSWSVENSKVMTISNFGKNKGTGTAVTTGFTAVKAKLEGTKELEGVTYVKVVNSLAGSDIPMFAQEMPALSFMKPIESDGNAYNVYMEQISQQVLPPPLPKTTLWGYGPDGACTYPGPIFSATKNVPLTVTWINNLPSTHILPIDYTLMGAEFTAPQNRAVVHLHGANVPSSMDGTPEQWFTPGLAQTGMWFETDTYTWPMEQEETTLWYHDHAMGITRLNTYAGLTGMLYIRSNAEKAMNLPSGKYETGLIIQDRFFYDDGSLSYPTEENNGIQPSVMPENFGDTIVVNGKAWPYMNVEPRKYRIRLLNASGSRFYHITLDNGGTSLSFQQIGSDGGFLNAPVTLNDLLVAPAERCDLIVDFTGMTTGTTITMRNDAPTPFNPGALAANPLPSSDPTAQIMQFKVISASSADTSAVPADLRPGNNIASIDQSSAVRTRNLTLIELTDQYGRILPTLNGMGFMDPVTEIVKNNTTEIWNIANLTDDTHPIHVHLVQFQVIDRRPFDVQACLDTGVINYTGPAVSPSPQESGWKDTLQMNPGEVTRIIMRFKSYSGRYLWHCHIIEHEDHDMMRYYIIEP